MAIFDEKIEITERCKGLHCVDLGESFPTLKCSDAGLLCAGISDAVSTQKEAKAAAPGRRQKATSGDKGAKKARVAPKGK